MSRVDELRRAVERFVGALDTDELTAAVLPFDQSERRTWAYWPTARRGVPMSDLDRAQTKALFLLLVVILGEASFAQATAIMALEEVLDRVEGHRDDRRHIGDYWLSVFGTPGTDPWGVRFEGHHVSVHVTVAGGEVRMTPLFLGANPAVVRTGPGGRHVVSAPLQAEEALGFELLAALTVEQRSSAIVADRAPADILTTNRPRLAGGAPEPTGVPLNALTGDARTVAGELVELYRGRFGDRAEAPDPTGVHFAWAGADRPGRGHYYRLSGPRLLVELDNTQNNANHVHTVVRDPVGDFGDDILAAHHARHHPT
jgi:hypothetical protein